MSHAPVSSTSSTRGPQEPHATHGLRPIRTSDRPRLAPADGIGTTTRDERRRTTKLVQASGRHAQRRPSHLADRRARLVVVVWITALSVAIPSILLPWALPDVPLSRLLPAIAAGGVALTATTLGLWLRRESDERDPPRRLLATAVAAGVATTALAWAPLAVAALALRLSG